MKLLRFFAVFAFALALGCGSTGSFKDNKWPVDPDGVTRVRYRLIESGEVTHTDGFREQVVTMTTESKAAWRDAFKKWSEVYPEKVVYVEDPKLSRESVGLFVIDSNSVNSSGAEGWMRWNASNGLIYNADLVGGPFGSNERLSRMTRLHEAGHGLLLKHSTIPRTIMFPLLSFLGIPTIEPTGIDKADLIRLYDDK